MATASRIVTGDLVGRLVTANKGNIEATSELLHIAERQQDPVIRKRLVALAKTVIENSDDITSVLLESPTGRG